MTTRWEVEAAVYASNIEPTGRHILHALLGKTTAATAEIPPKHAPTYTDLEALTGISRSALIEWMKALTDAGWVRRIAFEGESKEGFALSAGDPSATRAPRKRAAKEATGVHIPSPRTAVDSDGAYRQAVHPETEPMPPGGMGRTAERYSPVSPGGTNGSAPIRKNSPTESSLTTSTFTPPLFGEDAVEAQPASTKKARKPKKAGPYREDVERVCQYLVEWRVKNNCRRPAITEKWRQEARLMIDADERSLEQIRTVTAWSQKHSFWKSNIQSIPTLREKFDTLRLQMEGANEQERRNGNLGSGSRRSMVRNTHAKRDEYLADL